jgi:hypothetical protein
VDMTYLGQTQTRTPTSAADLEAMNAPASRLPGLCSAGNALACRLANIPQPTAEQNAQLASQRELQAVAERKAIANRLTSVGVNPSIVQAARTARDVIYAPSRPEGEMIYYWGTYKKPLILASVVLAGAGLLWFALS